MKKSLAKAKLMWVAGAALAIMVAAAFQFAPRQVGTIARYADRQLLRSETPAEVAPEADDRDPQPSVDKQAIVPPGPPRERPKTVSISGRLVTVSGEALPNARMSAIGEKEGWYTNARTDSDGRFTLPDVLCNTNGLIRLTHRRMSSIPDEPFDGRVEVGDTNIENLTVIVGPPLRMTGIVVDSAGEPRPLVHVLIRHEQSPQYGNDDYYESSQISGPGGQVRFRFLSPGTYVVSFRAGDKIVALSPEPQRIRVARDADLNDVVILCPDELPIRATRLITGTVTNERGDAVADAEIEQSGLQWSDVSSEANGGFVIAVLKEQNVVLHARHDDYSDSNRVESNEGTDPVTLVLPALASIEGRVLDAMTGRPIPVFRVTGIREQPIRVEDADGVFRFDAIKAGQQSLGIVARGYARTQTTFPAIEAGESRRNLEIRLEAGAEVEGRVLDAGGRPLRLARIHIVRNGGISKPDDVSNFDGAFYLSDVAPGPIKLQVHHDAYKPADVTYNVVRGVFNEVRVVLPEKK